MIQLFTYILFHILFHYGLSQDIEYSSLCYTVGPVVYSSYPQEVLKALSEKRSCTPNCEQTKGKKYAFVTMKGSKVARGLICPMETQGSGQ